jgi:hypothetical protein
MSVRITRGHLIQNCVEFHNLGKEDVYRIKRKELIPREKRQ